jgi:protein ImuA
MQVSRTSQEAAFTRVPQAFDPGRLPASVAALLWRGDSLGASVSPVLPSGFACLDAELPGGGWPCGALTELLQPQPCVVEWRLLGPALEQVAAKGLAVVVVGPPKPPHPPGLRHAGVDPRHLVWLQAATSAERLWCAEQLVRSNACGALVAWLPQARPEQIRRLQVGAQGCEGPVFVCRPAAAAHEASAAPLRVHVTFDADWHLRVRVLKRRGPVHDGALRLRSVPGGLDAVLTPRLRQPTSPTSPPQETADAVVCPDRSVSHVSSRNQTLVS